MKLLHTQTTYLFYSYFCQHSYDTMLKSDKWYERFEEHTASIIGVKPTTSQHDVKTQNITTYTLNAMKSSNNLLILYY